MRSMEVLRNLSEMEVKTLAAAVRQLDFKAVEVLCELCDPGEALYIVEVGAIELLNPGQHMQPIQRLERTATFGHMAFFTGAPHATIEMLLPNSSMLVQTVHRWLRTSPVATYQTRVRGMTPESDYAWCDGAVQSPQARIIPHPALKAERFSARAAQFRRMQVFNGLPPGELERITDSLIHKCAPRGHPLQDLGMNAEASEGLTQADRHQTLTKEPG